MYWLKQSWFCWKIGDVTLKILTDNLEVLKMWAKQPISCQLAYQEIDPKDTVDTDGAPVSKSPSMIHQRQAFLQKWIRYLSFARCLIQWFFASMTTTFLQCTPFISSFRKQKYDISYVWFYLTIFKIWIPNSYIISTSNSKPFHSKKNLRKQAVLDVGDLVLRKDSTPSAAGGATPVDATALGSEVFQALQVTASEAWGEGILAPKRVRFFFGWIWNKRGQSWKIISDFFLGEGVKKNGTCMCMCFLFAMIWTLGFELLLQ